MKKMILLLSMIGGLSALQQATAQDTTTKTTTHHRVTTTHTRTRYYYYPESNVYYNVGTGDYYYYDTPSTKWTMVRTLPETIVVDKTPRYTVYYNGEDVYRQNAVHLKKYKVKKNGTVKTKE